VGFSISWVATRGVAQDTLLGRLRLRRTGRREEFAETEPATALLPGGWALVWIDEFDEPRFAHAELAALSRGCELIHVMVEEHVMYCAAESWRDGAQIWFVSHDSQQGRTNLTAIGDLPESFREIKDDCMRKQGTDERWSGIRTDFVFDIPVETAYRVTGFRHDRISAFEGKKPFEVLEPAPGDSTTPI
jgi:hypothetical protein